MQSPLSLRSKQFGVALGMTAAMAISAVAMGIRPPRGIPWERPVIWSVCVAANAFWLLLAIARMARFRFFSADDIDGAGDRCPSATARVLQALVQNTLEQLVLAICVYAAWLWVATPAEASKVIDCTVLFFFGRLLFFIGYARGAPARALGFGLTFYPTAALFILLLPRLGDILWRLLQPL